MVEYKYRRNLGAVRRSGLMKNIKGFFIEAAVLSAATVIWGVVEVIHAFDRNKSE